jgi:hypothetical protein
MSKKYVTLGKFEKMEENGEDLSKINGVNCNSMIKTPLYKSLRDYAKERKWTISAAIKYIVEEFFVDLDEEDDD